MMKFLRPAVLAFCLVLPLALPGVSRAQGKVALPFPQESSDLKPDPTARLMNMTVPALHTCSTRTQ